MFPLNCQILWNLFFFGTKHTALWNTIHSANQHSGQTVLNKPVTLHWIPSSPFAFKYIATASTCVSVCIYAWKFCVFLPFTPSLNGKIVKCSHADMEIQQHIHNINHWLTRHFHGNCSNNTRGEHEPERARRRRRLQSQKMMDGWGDHLFVEQRQRFAVLTPPVGCRATQGTVIDVARRSSHGWHVNTREVSFATASALWIVANIKQKRSCFFLSSSLQ